MRRKVVRTLVILLCIAVAAGIAVSAVAELRYRLLFPAPRVSFETRLNKDTQAVAVIDPTKAMGFLEANALAASRVPAWVVAGIMPYEAAILIAPAPSGERIGLTMLVNEQRLGPRIAQAIRTSPAFQRWTLVTWEGDGVCFERRGAVAGHGNMAVNPLIRSAWDAVWKGSSLHARPRLEGGHFFEAAFDNRDGAAFTVVGTLILGNSTTLPEGSASPRDIAETVSEIQNGRIVADFTDNNTLSITLDVECAASMPQDRRSMFKFLWDMAFQQMQVKAHAAGAKLTGKSEWKNGHLAGQYTIEQAGALVGARRSD